MLKSPVDCSTGLFLCLKVMFPREGGGFVWTALTGHMDNGYMCQVAPRRGGHSFSCSPKKTNQKKGAAGYVALRVLAKTQNFLGAAELALRAQTVLAKTSEKFLCFSDYINAERRL